jgi:hypothetical protein
LLSLLTYWSSLSLLLLFFIIFLLFYFPAVYYIYFFVTSTLIHHTLSIKSFFVFIFYLFDYLGLGHPL